MPNVAAASTPWRVVLLSGADPAHPAALLLDRTLRHAIQAAAPNGVEFFADPFDGMCFGNSDLRPELLALLTKKYAQQARAIAAFNPDEPWRVAKP